MACLKKVFGGGSVGTAFGDEAAIGELYEVLLQHGVTTIDSARIYGTSEEWLGRTEAGTRFTIDTKTPGGAILGGSTGAGILQHAKESIQRLRVDKVST